MERRSLDKTIVIALSVLIITLVVSSTITIYLASKNTTEERRVDDLRRELILLIKEESRESEDRYLRIQSNVDSYQVTSERRSQLIMDKIDRLSDKVDNKNYK